MVVVVVVVSGVADWISLQTVSMLLLVSSESDDLAPARAREMSASLLFIFMLRKLFSTPPKTHTMGGFFYLARHVVAAHLGHLQLVPNLLKIFGTPSSVSVQLG